MADATTIPAKRSGAQICSLSVLVANWRWPRLNLAVAYFGVPKPPRSYSISTDRGMRGVRGGNNETPIGAWLGHMRSNDRVFFVSFGYAHPKANSYCRYQ